MATIIEREWSLCKWWALSVWGVTAEDKVMFLIAMSEIEFQIWLLYHVIYYTFLLHHWFIHAYRGPWTQHGSSPQWRQPRGGAVSRILLTGIGRLLGKDGSFLLFVRIYSTLRGSLNTVKTVHTRAPVAHSGTIPTAVQTLEPGEDGEKREHRQFGLEALLLTTAKCWFIVQVAKPTTARRPLQPAKFSN